MSTTTESQVVLELQELKRIRLEEIQNAKKTLMDRRNSNHQPFPDGAFEKLSRKNLWEAVFEYLDPASLASANSSCATFKSLSEESVVVQVFSLLKNSESLHLKPRDTRIPYWRNNHSVWNLRIVCKSWKRASEQIYLNEFSDPSWYINYPDRWFMWEHPISYCICGSSYNSQRASLLTLGGYTPALLFQVAEMNSVILKLSFLDVHGKYIQGLHFTINHDWIFRTMTSPVDRYRALVSVMTRLPNLQWLIVRNYCEKQNVSNRSNRLCLTISELPFPTIPSLKLIRFQDGYENEQILNEILRANPQVKSLMLPRETPVTPSLAIELERLTSLEAYHVRTSGDEAVSQVTSVLPSVNWPLKYLRLDVWIQVPTGDLYGLINRFAPTLESLHVTEYPYVRNHIQLELPHLKKIVFKYFASNASLHFLLPCRKLEHLKIMDHLNETRRRSRNNLCFGYGDRLEKSQVWKWFPKLVCARIEKQHGVENIRRPFHYVRKGLKGIVRISCSWDCDIKCKYDTCLR